MTDNTVIKTVIPSAMPIMEASEINETNRLRRFARVYRSPI
jgi:hypothetical protein